MRCRRIEREPLTSFGGPYVADPAWSPDGRRIAFTACPGGSCEIYTVSADGGKPERLRGAQRGDVSGSWSRDSKWIYFVSEPSGKSQLWKVSADGGDPVQITKQVCGSGAVEFPDGRFVYYSLASEDGGENTVLWRVPAEGGEEIRITGGVCLQCFAVVKSGVYFFSGWENPSIQRYDFATRKVEAAAKVEGKLAWGLTVSPDSRYLLYSVYGSEGGQNNLMMVEKFR